MFFAVVDVDVIVGVLEVVCVFGGVCSVSFIVFCSSFSGHCCFVLLLFFWIFVVGYFSCLVVVLMLLVLNLMV